MQNQGLAARTSHHSAPYLWLPVWRPDEAPCSYQTYIHRHGAGGAVPNGPRLRVSGVIFRHGGACPRRAMFATRTPPNDVATPPRSSPPWSDVSGKTLRKHRSMRTSRMVARERPVRHLVLNTPPRRQAPRWEEPSYPNGNHCPNPKSRTIRGSPRGENAQLQKRRVPAARRRASGLRPSSVTRHRSGRPVPDWPGRQAAWG